MPQTGYTPIQIYSSTTPTNAPSAGNLTNDTKGSELAINIADKNLFFKDSTNVVNTVPIRQSGAASDGWLSSTDWNTFNNKAPAGAYLTSVTADSPLSGAGTSASHLVIAQATTSTSGYLSSTDWNTFNNKQPAGSYLTAVTADAPLSGSGTSGSHLVIAQATTSTSGYLSSTDWNTFNNKQPAGTYVTSVSGTAPVVSSGGTTPAISMAAATGSVNGYLTSTDWTTFNGKQAALVSGTNIKTVNGTTLLGSGDLGTIGIGYGGTGQTSFTSGQIHYGSFSTSANLKFDGTTLNIGGTALSGGTAGIELGAAAITAYRLGQDSTHNGIIYWNYNATAGNANLRIETYGGNNPLFLQSAGGGVSIGNTTDPGSGSLGVNSQLFVNTTSSPSNQVSGNSYASFGGMVMESINNISVGTSSTLITKNGGYGLLVFINANQGGYNYNAILICTANGAVTVVSAPNSLGYGQTVSYSMGGAYNGQLYMSVSGVTGGNLSVSGIAFSTNRY